MTCPLGGTGDEWLFDTVRQRIQSAREDALFDEANTWSSYLVAVQSGHLDTMHFDNMMRPFERAPEDWSRLALFGGWSHRRFWLQVLPITCR